MEDHDAISPESSLLGMEPTSDQLELCLSESDYSSDEIINTFTEVLDRDDCERNLEVYQDNKGDEFEHGEVEEIMDETVPDPDREAEGYVRQDDEGDEFELRENEEMVDKIVPDPDQEAADYVRQHSPEIVQEQEGLDWQLVEQTITKTIF